MLKNLFYVKFNWGVYILALIFLRLSWADLSWIGFLAIAVSLHQFLLLYFAMGEVIPIRYLAGSLMCVQMLLGPTFAYNGLDAYQKYNFYQMKIPEMAYFSYALPAVILFIVGLHVTAGKLKGEIIDRNAVKSFIDHAGNLPYIFITAGFAASLVAGSFGSELAFVFTLIGNFKFIGLFMLLLGSRKLKIGVLLIVFGSIILSSLGEGMFHDLFTWLLMLGAVLAIKFKPGDLFKIIASTAFIVLAIVVQGVKGDYRKNLDSEGGNLNSFEEAYHEKEEYGSFFDRKNLAESNVRINQGYIITNIMSNIPANIPFENGAEMMRILEAAFLPRIIAPNKLNAGDRNIFMKYSGMQIRKGTSMGLSSLGDAYINFGILGGCIFMFLLGLLFSEVLNGFYKYSKYYPFLLLFTPLVFYYPIRPDCELQTSLGHLVKSCALIYFLILFWKKDLSKVMIKKKKALSTTQPIPN